MAHQNEKPEYTWSEVRRRQRYALEEVLDIADTAGTLAEVIFFLENQIAMLKAEYGP